MNIQYFEAQEEKKNSKSDFKSKLDYKMYIISILYLPSKSLKPRNLHNQLKTYVNLYHRNWSFKTQYFTEVVVVTSFAVS